MDDNNNEPDICIQSEEEDPDIRIGFILTREGRAWSDEGLATATDMVNGTYPPENKTPDDGILWTMGMHINAPKFLASLLRIRPDAFIILSLPDKAVLMPNDDGNAGVLIADLLEAADGTGQTSWSILQNVCDNAIERTLLQ